jgi:hypothetical protein
MIAVGIRIIRIVEENECPCAWLLFRALGQFRRGSPGRNETVFKEGLQGADELVEIDAERKLGPVDEGDRRDRAAIERRVK